MWIKLQIVGLVLSCCGSCSCMTVDEELTLTQDEKNALDKFKLVVQNDPRVNQTYMKEDIYLIKWIRIAKLDLARAEELFSQHLKFRKENNLDNILEEDFSDLNDIFPMYLDGEDLTGRPMIIADSALWDVRQGVIRGRRKDAIRYVYYALELMCKKIRDKQQMGQNVTQMQAIIDLKGFNYFTHACPNCLSIYVEFISSFIYRYPYMTDSLIFVNTPVMFEAIIDLLNLRRAKLVQIKIFGNNKKSEWQKYLLSIISRENLPITLGGIIDV